MNKLAAALEWGAWDNFLLEHVLGDTTRRIPIDPFRECAAQGIYDRCRGANVVCFHIDLSLRRSLLLRTAEMSDQLMSEGVFVVNGRVQDITKDSLRRHLISIGLPSCKTTREGPPNQMLIVKTNLNCGGRIEKSLPLDVIDSAGFKDLVSNDLGQSPYRVLRRESVPEPLWADRAHFIENFVNNSEDSFVRVNFSGQQIIIIQAYAPGHIKKLSCDPRDTNYVTTLEQLQVGTDLPLSKSLLSTVATFVENTPVEFGCIDIVHDDFGNYYIVDLNLTPYGGPQSNTELEEYLQLGIMDPACRKPTVEMASPLL